MSFTQRILLGMLAGIVTGVLLNSFAAGSVPIQTFLIDGVFNVIGSIFVALLQLMVVPLVLVSLAIPARSGGSAARPSAFICLRRPLQSCSH